MLIVCPLQFGQFGTNDKKSTLNLSNDPLKPYHAQPTTDVMSITSPVSWGS